MRSVVFLFVMLLYGTFANGQHVKIDEALLSSDPNVLQDVVILMHRQADLSAANRLKGKSNKALYVFSTLSETAQVSQKDLLTDLLEKRISHRSFYIVNMVSARVSLEDMEWIALRPDVRAILQDGVFMMESPVESRRQETAGSRAPIWNLTQIGVPEVWNKGITGQNTVIGGQDTGYAWEVSTIRDKYRGWNGTSAQHDYNWHDAVHNDNPMSSGTNSCGFDSPEPCDDHNHGTHTMGTMVGGVDNNGNDIGVAPDAQWIGCRNMENGYGTLTTYTECFGWFLAPYPVGGNSSQGDSDKMPHVINNSWGCPTIEGCNSSNWQIMETALNNLRTAGCVIVVSAGNSGSNCGTVTAPAAIFEGSYSVGATNSSDNIAGFSSRGPVTVDNSNRMKPDISAPGVDIRSCLRNGNFAHWQGTSMAGPHIAGVVSLMISANPALEGEVDKIQEIINHTALARTSTQNCGGVSGSDIPNNTFGHGIVDALSAVDIVCPSNYEPLVVYDKSIILGEAGKGIILTDRNNVRYKVSVSDTGDLVFDDNVQVVSSFHTLESGSLMVSSSQSHVILKSPDGENWKFTVSNDGQLSFSPVTLLPAQSVHITQGDIEIKEGLKGMILKSLDESCFIINVTSDGTLMTIPLECP